MAWANDRRLYVSKLARRIHKAPEAVVEELRLTSKGCRWMIERWALLADSAEGGTPWTDDQARLAFDLLGMPLEFRQGRRPGIQFDGDGRVVKGSTDPLDVARHEIDALKGSLENLESLEEVDQALTVANLVDENDAGLRRNRR